MPRHVQLHMAEEARVTESHPFTILNVDDSEAGRYSTTRILRKAGFEVCEAASGEEALELASRVEPDLVVLDINLPDMSGLEVCRRIKALFKRNVPVLHVSATYIMSSDKLLDSGSDGYLIQPVEPAALVANVRALLRARDAEEELHRQSLEWSAVLSAVQEALCITDAEGRVRRASAAFAELLGLSLEEITGQGLPRLFERQLGQAAVDLLARTRTDAVTEKVTLPLIPKPYELSVTAFHDRDEPAGLVLILRPT